MEISQSVTGGSDPDYISIMSPGFETWRKEIRSHSHHNVLSDRHGGWSGNDGTKDRVHDRREAHEYDRGHGFFRNNGIPCKYFAAGNCRNGENCWFSHDGPGSCNLDLEVKSRRGPNWSDTSVTPDVANDQRSCVSLNNRENSLAGPMWNGKAAGQNLCKIPHLTKNNSANMAVGESVYGSKPIDNVDTSVTEAVMGNNPLYINRVVDRQFPQDFQLYGNGQLSQLYTAVNLPGSIGMVPSQPTPAAVGINTPNQTTLSKRPCDPRVNFQQASPIVTPSKPPGCSPSTVEQNRVAEQMPLKGSVPSSLKDDFSEKKRKHQFHELEKLESVAACEAGVKSDKVDQRKKDRNNHLEDMDVNIQVEECKRSKDVKSIRMFKFALVDFVKDIIKPTWKAGQMSKEAHNTIVKKVVDKVIATIEEAHVPRTKEEIDLYLAFCKPKILKFVQAYVERYLKSSAVAGKP